MVHTTQTAWHLAFCKCMYKRCVCVLGREYRMANLGVRLALRIRTTGVLVFAASLCVYYFVRMESCLAWVATLQGFLPMDIVMTALIIVLLHLFQPKDPNNEQQILQVRSQGLEASSGDMP